jgi:molecular chaperone GrpE
MTHNNSEQPKEHKKSKHEKDEIKELQEKLQALQKDFETLQKEKTEIFEKYQRVSADYINYQKRVPKQIADIVGYEKEKIIKTLLPALDNFGHTLQKAHSAETVEDVLKGVRIIYEQICDILKAHEVEQIKSVGEKFDPALHQAMVQKSDPQKEEDVVLEEFQAGYKLSGRVIRPSRVVVNKLTSAPPPQTTPQENEKESAE